MEKQRSWQCGGRRLWKTLWPGWLALARWALMLAVLFASAPLWSADAAEVPSADAELGPCTADFAVTDAQQKPIFNAKIRVTIRHGFLGKRKTDLEVGTNHEGKARFQGLPSQARKSPLEFNVRHGDRTKTVLHYPAADCNARFTVSLED